MGEDIAAELLLFLLDEINIREHPVVLVPRSELSSRRCVEVEARQGDELQDKSTTIL